MKRTAVWASSLLLLASFPLAAADAERPDFSGKWTLDAARSDTGRPRGAGSGGPGGGEEGGRRPGGGEARGGGAGAGLDREAMRGGRERRRAEVATVEFARAGETGWTLRDGAGVEWSIEPDGTERAVTDAEGVEIYLRSDWTSKNGLMVRRVQAGRPTVEETYELTADGRTLTVTVKMTGGPFGEREMLRVYARLVEAAR